MLNPVNHARTRAQAERYRVEPYVVAGDISSHPDHVGRGGWTWYTGSAGWMYRVGLEEVLGVRRRGDVFEIDPCVPAAWPGYFLTWRIGSSHYEIEVANPDHKGRGVAHVELDGRSVDPSRIPIVDDGARHRVRVTLGERKATPGATEITPSAIEAGPS